jgi:DNA-binding HxlR family transcriptional regulator
VPTRRSYRDLCPIARALDVVGERWALLVVRELLLGPLRFSDLRRALPNASSNLVADRLRELEDRGVVVRRKLPPPAGAWVYELTEWGQALEPIVLALGEWGARIPPPPEPRTLSPSSAVLFLQGAARPDPEAAPAVGRLELDERVWTVGVAGGRLRAQAGEPAGADFSLRTDPETLVDLLEAPDALDAALADGSAAISGDRSALRAMLQTAGATP